MQTQQKELSKIRIWNTVNETKITYELGSSMGLVHQETFLQTQQSFL